MGSYCYLINHNERIRVEAYKLHGGGEDSLNIESEAELVKFLEYCREKDLLIQCVHESMFEMLLDRGVVFKELSDDINS